MTRNAWTTLVSQVRAHARARARVRLLERDLAAFTTPSEIEDLLAAADRTEGPETELVRSILTTNLMAYYERQGIAA